MLEYLLKMMCCYSLGERRRNKNVKKHYLFEKAEEKFMNELDIVRLVKSLRKFKMLLQALLT